MVQAPSDQSQFASLALALALAFFHNFVACSSATGYGDGKPRKEVCMYRALVFGLALLVPLPAAWSDDKSTEDKLKVEGKLSPDDPKDKVLTQRPHKVHEMKMKAGRTYQIDLVSTAFDSFLRLEDSTGKQLAQDDDSGGDLNARIVFKAPKDDTYRIIVLTFNGQTGPYTLTVAAPSQAGAALSKLNSEMQQAMQTAMMEAMQAAQADVAVRFIERFSKFAQENPGTPEAVMAVQTVNQQLMMLGSSHSPATAKVLRHLVEKATDKSIQAQAGVSLGRLLRNQYEKAYQNKDQKALALYKEAEKTLTDLSKKFFGQPMLSNQIKNQIKDALFELEHLTLGKSAQEIEGEDLDGKKFKLSDYRGKVVVLDFWGNW
jgi:hypothetical protein